MVREAQEILKAAAPLCVVNHSDRAFLLGRAWGAARKIGEIDEEGFYLAALFHDLGLCEHYRDTSRAFQLNSSRALKDFLEGKKTPLERITPLAEAIEFHMQVRPRWASGNVAGLLQIGAWMDLMALRRWAIWSDAKQIAAALPREGIDLQFPKLLAGSIDSVASCVGLMAPNWGKTS